MRYVEKAESEILDTKTNLVWQRSYETMTFDEAHAYAKRVSDVTGQQWRVPTLDELTSLIDRSTRNPASAFPGMPPVWFWSSSPYVGYTSCVWGVNFGDGSVYGSGSRGYGYGAVRLVRDAIP
jgi:hypothetical protein